MAQNRVSKIRSMEKKSGQYEARLVNHSGSFINFVLVCRDKEKILWFGWLVGPGVTHDAVYRTSRPDIIEMFEQYFNDQYKNGKLVT